MKLLSGNTKTVDFNWNFKVWDLKTKIEEEEGIPILKQHYIFAGKPLDSNERFLIDYGIQPESTVHQRLILTGGGPLGFDFSSMDKEKMSIKNWSDSAPNYRVACQGLNIEGMTDSHESSCEGMCKEVIYHFGFGIFNVGRDLYTKLNCPLCKKQPAYKDLKRFTCAFSNCNWKYYGIQEGQEKREEGCADDKYYRMPSGPSDTVEWSSLEIETFKIRRCNIF